MQSIIDHLNAWVAHASGPELVAGQVVIGMAVAIPFLVVAWFMG
ncbi:hypothetical protein [Mycobacterium sp. CnD-18-1]|nr:hypothetical protein [Mycobacterium sp. CnD-18-1]